MKKTLVLCGDSFNYGIGCTNLYTKPYGVLTANHFDWNLIRLARGSASNYVIHLQGVFASKMIPKPHLVILGMTSYDRVEWVTTGKDLTGGPKFENVNYHLYPPHHHPQPLHDKPMPYYLENSKQYNPVILSEQVVAFDDYLKLLKKDEMNGYYERLWTESKEKIELINRYYMEVVNSQIKRDYDTGVLMLAYNMIKKAGISCIIVGADTRFENLVDDPRDFFNQNWGEVTKKWPDTVNSLHTGDGGHEDTANRLIKHIENNGFV